MSPDPWKTGNDERDGIYAKQRNHGPNSDGGTESAQIPMEDFNTWSHRQIKNASDAFDPEKALGVSNDWNTLSSGFNSALETFNTTFNTAVEGTWTGLGAEAATQGVANYKSHAEKVADGMALMATKPAEAETAMTQVKALMPEPLSVKEPQEQTQTEYYRYYADQAEANKKEEEARMIMRTVYSPVFKQASDGIPALPPAPDLASGPAPQTTQPSSTWGAGAPTSPEKVSGMDEGAVRAQAMAAFAQDTSAPAGAGAYGAGAAPVSAAATGLAPGTGTGTPFTAASAAGLANRSTSPASGSGSDTEGKGGAIPGTYGIGRWNRSTKKDEDDQKGQAVPLVGPIVAGAYSPGGVLPSTAPSPMSGMGLAHPPTMMGPGAAQHRQRENEDEHFTPEFLVSMDNGNELIGPLPKVAPAVIGVWTEEHIEYQNPKPSPYDPRPREEDE